LNTELFYAIIPILYPCVLLFCYLRTIKVRACDVPDAMCLEDELCFSKNGGTGGGGFTYQMASFCA